MSYHVYWLPEVLTEFIDKQFGVTNVPETEKINYIYCILMELTSLVNDDESYDIYEDMHWLFFSGGKHFDSMIDDISAIREFILEHKHELLQSFDGIAQYLDIGRIPPDIDRFHLNKNFLVHRRPELCASSSLI